MRLLALVVLAAALVGCGPQEVLAKDVAPPKDKYAGMTPQQKIDAIRADPTIQTVERHTKIADAQKAAGLSVTGQ